MIVSNQEIDEFKVEAFELLDLAERSLLSLDSDGPFQENYDAIFRTFHNIKGAAGMMNLEVLQAHMHVLENLLVAFQRSGSMPKEKIDAFLKGVDSAKTMLRGPVEGLRQSNEVAALSVVASPPIEDKPATKMEIPDSALNEFVCECEEISQRVSINFSAIEKGAVPQDVIDSVYRDIHTLKGSALLFGFEQLGTLAHSLESVLEPVRRREKTLEPSLADKLFAALDLVDDMVSSIKSKKPLLADERLDKLIYDLGTSERSPAPTVPATIAPPPSSGTPPGPKSPGNPPEIESDSTSSVRVPVTLLDKLMILMGEMVLVRNQVLQFASRTDDLEFLNLSQHLNVVTTEIQAEMMKTRMQPIGNILNKFHRMVRDLSKDLKKDIELTISGAETELDKTLLEAVKDPLTHVIRNACDHGIETPEVRTQNGKSGTGNIAIRSYHEGGQVIVEVKDDGRGLIRDKILAKALEKGLVSAEKAGSLKDSEVMDFIFAPGFSTADSVTNVSGRGVGMDVVRNNIDRIGGSVELSSEPNKGATIRLKIPLTLAIVPAMIVRCDQDQYAIPQVKLVELVRVEKGASGPKIEFIEDRPVYRLRGKILPLLDLKQVLKFDAITGEVVTEAVNIVVVNADRQYLGLIVDEIVETADIVVKPLNRFLKFLSTYSGATVLGDGSVALILDVVGIAKDQQL